MKRISAILATLALILAACASGAESPTTSTASLAATPSTTSTTTTLPPSTTTTTEAPAAASEPTSEADRNAITAAYGIVFSSKTTFDEKAPLIDDPSGLEETVLKYQETGESMGGVSLVATKITVEGDIATVIYDFLFGGTPTYPDLTGDAVLVDGTWKISRTMFCSIMGSARVGCPAP